MHWETKTLYDLLYLRHSFYCSGLEANPQDLWDMPIIELNFYLDPQCYGWWKLCHSELRVKLVIYLFFSVAHSLGCGEGNGQRLVICHQGMRRVWPSVVTWSPWFRSSMTFPLLSNLHNYPASDACCPTWSLVYPRYLSVSFLTSQLCVHLGLFSLSHSWVSPNCKGK